MAVARSINSSASRRFSEGVGSRVTTTEQACADADPRKRATPMAMQDALKVFISEASHWSPRSAMGRLRSSGSKPKADIGLRTGKQTLAVSAKGGKRTLVNALRLLSCWHAHHLHADLCYCVGADRRSRVGVFLPLLEKCLRSTRLCRRRLRRAGDILYNGARRLRGY